MLWNEILGINKSVKFTADSLKNMRIAVTKLEEKSQGIPDLFRRFGHEAIILTTMRASEPADIRPLMQLSEMISKGDIDILIFTSALGVDKLFRIIRPGKDLRIISVGPKTAKKVEGYSLTSEIIESFSSENFADYLGNIKDKTIGIARADIPNPELIDSLISKGARVVEAPAYRLEPSGNNVLNVLMGVDAVIFTSAKSFLASGFTVKHAKKINAIAIGKKTAAAMRKSGIDPGIIGNGTIESCLALLNKGVADACK